MSIDVDEQLLAIAKNTGSLDSKMDTVVRQATQHDRRIGVLEVNDGRHEEKINALSDRFEKATGYSRKQVAIVASGSGVIGLLLKALSELWTNSNH